MASTVRLSLSGADCKVCFQAYDAGWRRPRALPCGHTFCSICMASIIRDGRLTCPGCQAHHPVEMVTQLPVNYELESLLKLQPVLEAEYYHDKAGPISLSDVMCTEHNCDVYLRCTTHKAWICQQCTLGDHPINKCKIISISEELEVRKESLLMFLNEEYERSVQSLLRVRQSLAQVEDEDKKHEEVIGHMAEIILQHRDEQGHLEVQREALEQSIEDLKDKAWVLDQAVVNLQDALSVQQIVASCQEAQANLAYIKDFADVSNIEQTSMDAILHSYKIRATTSMGLHAMHGNGSNDNDEPEKPTTSDVDKNKNSQKQENYDDTGINQVDYTPTLERSMWHMMPPYSSGTTHVQEASEDIAQRFCQIWDMPRCPSLESLEPQLPPPRHERTPDCKSNNSNHSIKSDGNQEPSQKEEENIASLYEKLWNIPKYTQPHVSPEPKPNMDQMHDTGWKSSMYSAELPVKENGILHKFDQIWGLPRSSSIVSLNNTDELENEPTQENSWQSQNYQVSSIKPEIPKYPSKQSIDNSNNSNCHDISSSIYMDITERLSPTIILNKTSKTDSRDLNNLSPSNLIPDKLPKHSQDDMKYPYSESNNVLLNSKIKDVNNISKQVNNSPLHTEKGSTNTFKNLWKKSHQQAEATTPDKEESHSSPFEKLWKKSNLTESKISADENTPLRSPIKLQKSSTVKSVKKFLQSESSTGNQLEENTKVDESLELDTNNSEDFSRISFSEEVDYSTGYQSGDGQVTDKSLHTYHTNLPFIEEEQENFDSNSDVEPTHDNPWKLSKLSSCVPL